jgi:hypothetical protein
MLNDNEPATIAELKEENLRLEESLKRCHALVDDCRQALTKTGEGSFLLNPRRDASWRAAEREKLRRGTR